MDSHFIITFTKSGAVLWAKALDGAKGHKIQIEKFKKGLECKPQTKDYL